MTVMSERFAEPETYCCTPSMGAKAQTQMHEHEMAAFKDRNIEECIKFGCMERGAHCICYGAGVPLSLGMAAGCFLASIPGILATLTCGTCTAVRCIVCCGDEQSENLAISTIELGILTRICCAFGGGATLDLAVNTLLLPSKLLCPEICTCHQNYALFAEKGNKKLEELEVELAIAD